jgi:hypothetical protein
MVERFHRQLKSPLKCRETENWTEILPIVLLGIRTAIKEDKASSSELHLGSEIRLSGDFFPTNTFTACNTDLVNNYKQNLRKIQPVSATHHGTRKSFIFKELFIFLYVFVHPDSVEELPQPPYDSPFIVKKP